MTFLEVTIRLHDERERQIAKWGEQHHSHLEWLGILVEEVGEAAEAIVKRFVDNEGTGEQAIIKEIIHLTAVGMAWLEDKMEAE